MASKKGAAKLKNRFEATLVTGDRLPCAFCQREIDDELTYGKLYAIGNIQVHYFCVLLSCCLVQKGKDTEGLFGFLYPDIIAELERSKKHKCSYCNIPGATLGCCVVQCRKQFHLPCGREKNAVSLFYGNYKSYCQLHVPKQKIPDHIMEQARIRKKKANSALKAPTKLSSLKELCDRSKDGASASGTDTESVCVICYEAVDGFPTVNTFWPPCCARDAWFHRTCLQRMALSAGMHYLKCPLCNDKEQFYDAVVDQGYYVPDRDAAWELEQNAFAEIYERPAACSADRCLCPNGREHDAENGEWDIKLCILCGTSGCHAACLTNGNNAVKASAGKTGRRDSKGDSSDGTRLNICPDKEYSNNSVRPTRFVCDICMSCAPEDMDSLATRIEAVILSEQRSSQQRANGPIMPSRMSLRRTKARVANGSFPSTSQDNRIETQNTESSAEAKDKKTVAAYRLELNLKPPKKPSSSHPPLRIKTVDNILLSPVRQIEENLSKKIHSLGMESGKEKEILCKVKERLKKPRPLCEKKKIVNSVLEKLFDDIFKTTSPTKSPKKTPRKEITEKTEQKPSAQSTPEKLPNGRNSKILPSEDNTVVDDDKSSDSSFQLPAEFIADRNSDESLPLFETPKKLKTVDIHKGSTLEICENNEVVNVNVVKIEDKDNKEFMKLLSISPKTEKCVLKFNTKEKTALAKKNLDIDTESFKSYYLNEVDKGFKCDFNHKHNNITNTSPKLRTAIDFAYDAFKKRKIDEENKRKKLKRKSENKVDGPKRKLKKKKGLVVKYSNSPKNIEVVCSNGNEDNSDTDFETPKIKKKQKKLKKNKQGRDSNIQVKIRFKKEQVKLKITQSQIKRSKKLPKTTQTQMKRPNKLPKNRKKKMLLTQYVLNVCENSSPNTLLIKPDHDLTPRKRKYVKSDHTPDKLVQTSIQNFFKKVPSIDPELKE